MSSTLRERADWWVSRLKAAMSSVQEAFPSWPEDKQHAFALRLACADGLSYDLEALQAAINRIESCHG